MSTQLKQYTTIFSNPTFNKHRQQFQYRISINDAEGNELTEFEKSYDDLLFLFDQLASKHHYLFFEETKSLAFEDNLNYEDYVSLKSVLQRALEEVLERRDIMAHDIVLDLCKPITGPNDDFYPVTLAHKTYFSETLNMGQLLYEPSAKLFFACTENSGALARAGRVWSLIDPELNGVFRAFKWTKTSSMALMPHFKKLFKQEYEVRCQTCLYNNKTKVIYVGFNSGNIAYSEFKEQEEEAPQVSYSNVIDEPILGMEFASKDPEDIILFTENNVKIIDSDGKVVGGGSLRKRLQGAYLASFAVDVSKKLMFFGSSEGKIYVYSYSKLDSFYRLKFCTEHEVKEGFAVEHLEVAGSCLISSCRLDVNILTYVVVRDEFSFKGLSQFVLSDKESKRFAGDETITKVKLIKSRRVLVTTYSNGFMLFWSTDLATVTGALRAHENKITNLILDEDNEIIITTGLDTETKVWKFGSKDLSAVVLD